jgi:non-ribosomal peptide synthetase-like protein
VAVPIEVLTTAPAAAPAVQDGHVPPAGDIQAVLAGMLADLMDVDQVPVDSDFFHDLGADSMVMARFCARVRKQADLPSVSMKDVYQHPTIAGLATALSSGGACAPAPQPAAAEAALAQVLAEVLHVDRVPVDSHFFDDLGADSMVMAQFCARVRKRPELPSVSIKDVYQHPTIGGLAAAYASAVPAAVDPATPAPTPPVSAPTEVPVPAGTSEYVLCGVLQFLFFLGYTYLAGIAFERSYDWIAGGGDLLHDYERAATAGAMTFVGMCALPILAKWVLIGRWKPQQIRIWSLAYVRFWLVKTLVMANPLILFAGSPILVWYLRALGAKVGRGVTVFTRHVPVCTDLLTIGDGTVIRKDSYLNCYRAHAGLIQTGPVTLGRDVLIGDKSVLDIGTSMGDGTQLGHASSLHPGQAVPDGERWHGSPAERTETDYRLVGPADCSTWRRARYATAQLLMLFLVYLPLGFGGLAMLLLAVPWLARLMDDGALGLLSPSFYVVTLGSSLVLVFGGLVVRFLLIISVPRLLNLAIKPDRVYRLYGFRYGLHRTIAHFTNSKVFGVLTGDSSYVVPYLRSLGWKLTPLVQTGSNFGNEVKHETPYLSGVGTGTVVASGLSMLNAHYSSTSFTVTRTSIGTNNFLGNDIVYPPGGRTGDNCLLATKVLVPIDGHVREGVGLLGSPSFEIPRTVARDSKFARLATEEEIARRLPAKNRYNLVTSGIFLLARWFYLFMVLLVSLASADLYASLGSLTIPLASLVVLLISLVYFPLVERAATGFRGVKPRYCSIYTREFWAVERFFKLTAKAGVHRLCVGTPFQSLLHRLVGVKVGKRLFDDGVSMSEKNIVTLGDDVTLNVGSVLQCHSQEDYAFKCDGITIGSGCTVGVAAFVHYGVTMGDNSVLAADSFLMKGEEVPPNSRWGGNPAREMPEAPVPVQPRTGADDRGPALGSIAVRRPRPTGGYRADERQPAVLGAMAMADGGPR